MTLRACLGCARPTAGTRCPRCAATPRLRGRAGARLRRAALMRAGFCCEWPNGCTARHDLEVHHDQRLVDGGANELTNAAGALRDPSPARHQRAARAGRLTDADHGAHGRLLHSYCIARLAVACHRARPRPSRYVPPFMRRPMPAQPGCHCLCAANHRDHAGVCEGSSDTALAFDSPLLGRVVVPMCSACATHTLAAADLRWTQA
jgi:hypothetical protein